MKYRVILSHEPRKVSTGWIVRWNGEFALDYFTSSLEGRPGIRNSRVGSWRILLTVDREIVVIYFLTMDTRGRVYKHS